MADELFGPFFARAEVPSLGRGDRPQSMDAPKNPFGPVFLFSQSLSARRPCLAGTELGGSGFNYVVMQVGGAGNCRSEAVGASGMGNYHGKAGFEPSRTTQACSDALPVPICRSAIRPTATASA